MKKRSIIAGIVLMGMVSLFVIACKKENIQEKPAIDPNESVSGRKIKYTVLVVHAENSTKSIKEIDSAIVSLAMNDKIYSMPTDTNGMAVFNNIVSGTAAVSIRMKNHTTANLIVDLYARNDSSYDASNIRNASTMVALFPITGIGTARVKGIAFAELDLTNSTREFVPSGIGLQARIETNQLLNYFNHSGEGKILSAQYENVIISSLINSAGAYELNVPASARGLKIILNGDDFDYLRKLNTTDVSRTIYSLKPDTILVYSNRIKIRDLNYIP